MGFFGAGWCLVVHFGVVWSCFGRAGWEWDVDVAFWYFLVLSWVRREDRVGVALEERVGSGVGVGVGMLMGDVRLGAGGRLGYACARWGREGGRERERGGGGMGE